MIPNSVSELGSFAFWGYMLAVFGLIIPVSAIISIPPFSNEKYTGSDGSAFFDIIAVIMMVIYAGGSIALAVLLAQGYNPLELPTTLRFRIALITFAILQVPIIAAARLTWASDIAPHGVPILEGLSQYPAVLIAHGTSGWLESLFFA